MAEVITFGETMVAFCPRQRGYLHYIKDYEMKIAGAESNFAVGVSKLGHSAEWISYLGKDEFGMTIQNAVRAEGVDTRHVMFSEEYRTGVMFKQMQSTETEVFYYRENSAASHMTPEMLNEDILSDGKILHLTGITPVLSESCQELVLHALDLADKRDILVSFDPNIRRKLWKSKDYSPLFREIVSRSDIVMLGLDEGTALYGTEDEEKIIDSIFTHGKTRYIALKKGDKGVIVADHSSKVTIPPYPCHCVDPIGAGDAFNAGFICGILEGRQLEICGQTGAIAGAMATENNGDIEGYPAREQLDKRLYNNREEVYR